MSIDKDIQQASFVNSRQKAMINILYTYGYVIERIKDMLASENITHQQYNILRILRGSYPKPISTLQIRERMLDKMSDTSRIVDRLVAKGFAKKVLCATDKRLVDVTISDKGQKLLKKLDNQSDHTAEIMANLSEKESEQLSNLLDKLRGSD